MQRSMKGRIPNPRSVVVRAPLASAVLLALSPACAEEITGLGEVIVTAQKRAESLQDVPLSIQAIPTERLEQLHVASFADYAKFLPSLSYQSGGQSGGPGFSRAYMRGVATGGDGVHSGSLPSVGTYLDEQPITTIQGALDVHIYDVERVEVLAGPQGTLYGASSQSGTIRIITNKPDPAGFAAGYDLEANSVSDGDTGYLVQGFVNMPISSNAAIRLVGWGRHDAGYIDNVPGTVTYPTSGVTINNTARVEENYNDADTYGARAALKIDLNDTWTVTTGVMGQKQSINGSYGYRTSADLDITRFNPESTEDRWMQAALTVQGKFASFDVVYAGSYLNRKDEVQSDYVDYSFYYDDCCGYGSYIFNDNGDYIDPTQYILGKDRYDKQSHELRISSTTDGRLQYVAGLFAQDQSHDIEQRYVINDIATSIEVTGWDDTWWLTEQVREDKDYALFGELTYDITDKLSVTGGIRFFESRNSIVGFLGFGLTNDFTSATGEKSCNPLLGPAPSVNGGPCTNLNKSVKDTGNSPKLNFTYRFDDQRLVYATYSEGFRPGGINRRLAFPAYQPDFLTNYEVGWKTAWAGDSLRFNGALFHQDWEDAQFAFLGQNSLTQIVNAGSARIRGVEADLLWAATDNLTLIGGVSFIDAELTDNFCEDLVNGAPVDNCASPAAVPGTELPVTPDFKANLSARYNFSLGAFDAHVQGAMVYSGSRWPDLRSTQRAILGREPSYTIADFTFGIENDAYSVELFVNNAFDKRAQLDRWAQCDASVCGVSGTYITPTQPRTVGLRFGQRF